MSTKLHITLKKTVNDPREIVATMECEFECIECVSNVIMTYAKWMQIKKYLSTEGEKFSVILVAGAPPYEHGDNSTNGKEILSIIKIHEDPQYVQAFRTLYGEDFHSDNNFWEQLLDEIHRCIFGRQKIMNKITNEIADVLMKIFKDDKERTKMTNTWLSILMDTTNETKEITQQRLLTTIGIDQDDPHKLIENLVRHTIKKLKKIHSPETSYGYDLSQYDLL